MLIQFCIQCIQYSLLNPLKQDVQLPCTIPRLKRKWLITGGNLFFFFLFLEWIYYQVQRHTNFNWWHFCFYQNPTQTWLCSQNCTTRWKKKKLEQNNCGWFSDVCCKIGMMNTAHGVANLQLHEEDATFNELTLCLRFSASVTSAVVYLGHSVYKCERRI